MELFLLLIAKIQKDLNRVKETLSLLVFNDEFINIPLLVFANKQDLSNAYLPKKIINIFDRKK